MKAASGSEKLFNSSEILAKAEEWRSSNQTIAFTNGVFDLLHVGHLYSLEKAASFADRLIVGVNSDASAKSLNKGSDRPFVSDCDRATLLSGLAVVDAVVIFEASTPFELIASLKPDILVKGDDWARDEVVGREFAGRVELLGRLGDFSTTNLIDRIRKSRD